MQRYIAFLRAVNVGGRTVKMALLRDLFTRAGFDNAETFIASGNVIFETTALDPDLLERQIERLLKDALGFDVETFIRTPGEVADITSVRPFSDSELAKHALYVVLLPAAPAAHAAEKLLALENEIDAFRIQGREVYWLARKGIGESNVSGGQIERALEMTATTRNVTTLRKLAARYAAA